MSGASARLKERQVQPRSEKTRQKIKAAFVDLLNKQGYSEITITDICRLAKVATGGFYFHYEKKADLIEEVIREHSEQFWSSLGAALLYQDPYSALFHASTALVSAYRTAPGLVRCFNQLAMSDRTYVRIWNDAALHWNRELVATLSASADADPALLTQDNADGLLSFVDLFLFKIYIEQDERLVIAAGAPGEVIENVAVLWHRALIGHSPPPSRLAYSGQDGGV